LQKGDIVSTTDGTFVFIGSGSARRRISCRDRAMAGASAIGHGIEFVTHGADGACPVRGRS
jgi:hypothetical protein